MIVFRSHTNCKRSGGRHGAASEILCFARRDDEAHRALQRPQGLRRWLARQQNARLRADALQRDWLSAAQRVGRSGDLAGGRPRGPACRDQDQRGIQPRLLQGKAWSWARDAQSRQKRNVHPMTSTWRASWENEKGEVEYVDLGPLD